MSHRGPRLLFVAACLVSGVLAVLFVAAALQPKPVPIVVEREIVIAPVAALRDGVPDLVSITDLKGLDAVARRLRSTPYIPMSRSVRPGDLPVYIVKEDGSIRAFIAIDPRNGCDLRYEDATTKPWGRFPAGFHDICHGSFYDLDGNLLGGPSPWAMDELVVTVREGKVYADRSAVLPGRLVRP